MARVDEQFMIWMKKNKKRKLTLLKDKPSYDDYGGYAGGGGGLNHEAWLEKKAEEKAKRRERAAKLGNQEEPVKKNNFIHNLDFEEWAEQKAEQILKKKLALKEEEAKQKDYEDRRKQENLQKFEEWLGGKDQFWEEYREKQREEQERIQAQTLPDPEKKREPVIPEEWIKKDNKRRRLKRKEEIKRRLEEKKKEVLKKEQKVASELGWAAWVKRKEEQRLKELIEAGKS